MPAERTGVPQVKTTVTTVNLAALGVASAPQRPKGRGVRRQPGEMNKLEAAYAEHLKLRQIAGEIAEFHFEAVTLRLAARTGYTPDFMVLEQGGEISFHETKGFMRDDANVKLKVAARMFPFRFVLVYQLPKKQGGGWSFKEIAP